MARFLQLSQVLLCQGVLGIGFAIASTLLPQASVVATTHNIYRFHGLKPARGLDAEDGIFQDFSRSSDNLAQIWADPDATVHEGTDVSWVRGRIQRPLAQKPYLTIDFTRQGYGANLTITPSKLIPEKLPESAVIRFEARSADATCIGLRMMDRDGEIWSYGEKVLEYERLCLEPNQEWTTLTVPIGPRHTDWQKFPHGGNVDLGNSELEAELIALLSLELGLAGGDYLAPGQASLDVRDIRVVSDPSVHASELEEELEEGLGEDLGDGLEEELEEDLEDGAEKEGWVEPDVGEWSSLNNQGSETDPVNLEKAVQALY